MTHLAVPQPALSKRGSLTPSVRRLLNRYPPAILEDNTPPPERIQEQEEIPQATRARDLPLTSFDRRFPQGYKVADVSIPLHPDEVPPGSENIFSPEYNPICRRVPNTPPLDRWTSLTIDVYVGISVSLVVGCWGSDFDVETNWLELDYGSEGVLGASSVVEIEWQVWEFMRDCLRCFVLDSYCYYHGYQELYSALARGSMEDGQMREWLNKGGLECMYEKMDDLGCMISERPERSGIS